MAKVKAFTVPGLYLWIPSGDHQPPHFHVQRSGEWFAKVEILTGKIEMQKPPDARMKGSHRRALEDGVAAHRAALLTEWDSAQGN